MSKCAWFRSNYTADDVMGQLAKVMPKICRKWCWRDSRLAMLCIFLSASILPPIRFNPSLFLFSLCICKQRYTYIFKITSNKYKNHQFVRTFCITPPVVKKYSCNSFIKMNKLLIAQKEEKYLKDLIDSCHFLGDIYLTNHQLGDAFIYLIHCITAIFVCVSVCEGDKCITW